MSFSWMWGRVALDKTDVSEKRFAFIIRVIRLLVTPSVVSTSRYVPVKSRLVQEPHGVTSQKTTFFTVTARKQLTLSTTVLFLNVIRRSVSIFRWNLLSWVQSITTGHMPQQTSPYTSQPQHEPSARVNTFRTLRTTTRMRPAENLCYGQKQTYSVAHSASELYRPIDRRFWRA
jgi:hypothetical protein